jgi:hypothetical protein
MDKLIDTIRLALADDATPEIKQAGAQACRTIQTALEAQPGTSMAVVPAVAASPLAGADIGQVLDLLIGKLRTMVPEPGPSAPSPKPLSFPTVVIPKRG